MLPAADGDTPSLTLMRSKARGRAVCSASYTSPHDDVYLVRGAITDQLDVSVSRATGTRMRSALRDKMIWSGLR
jgi:hypothetical protein